MSQDHENTEQFLMPSDFENIDAAIFEWVDEKLNIFATTNTGWRKVKCFWANEERSFMVKSDKERRDSEGTLILPIIAVKRGNVQKDLSNKGYFGVNLFPINDEKGGTLTIARIIQQDKTKEFVNNDSKRRIDNTLGQENGRNRKPEEEKTKVYEILTTAYPVYLDIAYEINIKTEYLQQMNEILTPFITKPGGINSFMLRRNGHKYEAFIQQDFGNEDNADSLDDKERTFNAKVQIKVLGYIMGQGKNDPQPKVTIRETAAKFRLQRERIIVGDINQEIKKGFYRP